MSTLRDLGEFGLIDRLSALLPGNESVVTGIGDDCAVVRAGNQLLLISCDASIEGVHFQRDWAEADAIGWKACAAALSDIAAMGGRARFVLVTLGCPGDTDAAYLEGLYRGMSRAAAHCGAVIVGGDTTASPQGIFIDVFVIGEPVGGRYLLRQGARPGDVLAVSGWPGLSAAGLDAMQRNIAAPGLIDAHLQPLPRIDEGQWLAAEPAAHALIDLSDGLLQDAGHIASASGLGLDVAQDALPISPALAEYARLYEVDPAECILEGGEDYELICAMASDTAEAISQSFQTQFHLPLTIVGRFTEAWAGIRINGKAPSSTGYEHFRRGAS